MNTIETRRLSVLLTVSEVERLRKLLRPDEGMNDLLRRLLREAIP